ncbi:MAG TPA: response regulator [Candidatus Rubrimentiphilum sp.]|nr:response regulator [Candidatus Rubrimentiphilum sp.]
MTSASYTVVLVTGDPLYGARLRRAFIKGGRGVCLFLAGSGANTNDLPPVQAQTYPRPHVFLLDLDLPWDEAIASLSWLRKRPEFADVPVVALARQGETEIVKGVYRGGANACVLKPMTEKEMREIASGIGDYAYLLQIKPSESLVWA